jgi:L,D-peptidoglycan transpeptidase YkuD (ErfK/YbiS/YcfS/YnhG family)
MDGAEQALVLAPSGATQGHFRWAGRDFRCALGRAGASAPKREGDGATPLGLLPLRRVLYRADRGPPPRAAVPVEPLAPSDGWCDDPADAAYNRPVTLPFTAGHEQLWRADEVYDIIGVLGWNDAPVRRGLGSAIFLHLARPNFAPTEGCIALSLPDLRTVLAGGLRAIEVRLG